MTSQERAGKIRALLEERYYCEVKGYDDRVKLIDAALRQLGHEGASPEKRAEKRPTAERATRR